MGEGLFRRKNDIFGLGGEEGKGERRRLKESGVEEGKGDGDVEGEMDLQPVAQPVVLCKI